MTLMDLFPLGERVTIGTYLFDEGTITRFARQFDPQTFHMDAEAAKISLFGGLCASGWHTCAAWSRCFQDYLAAGNEARAADGTGASHIGRNRGFRELKWLRPVFAGSTLTYAATLVSSETDPDDPALLVTRFLSEGFFEDGALAVSFQNEFNEPR
ncbi:MaoC/PaaZ C-terminal domain-containing protein [Oryzifoliimicrobium ureilyticus]|uniref:MaoC/PaaZ C-terminal domain-containing protein n=1 Tax=Oryzifoliimicrobium ureilyticus TaxID=3113724 RepID=UPI0030762D16